MGCLALSPSKTKNSFVVVAVVADVFRLLSYFIGATTLEEICSMEKYKL